MDLLKILLNHGFKEIPGENIYWAVASPATIRFLDNLVLLNPETVFDLTDQLPEQLELVAKQVSIELNGQQVLSLTLMKRAPNIFEQGYMSRVN